MPWLILAALLGAGGYLVFSSHKREYFVPVIGPDGRQTGENAGFSLDQLRATLPSSIGPRMPDYFLDARAGAAATAPTQPWAFLFRKLSAPPHTGSNAFNLTDFDAWIPPFSVRLVAAQKGVQAG